MVEKMWINLESVVEGLGETLVFRRKYLKITQKHLANRLGVKEQSIQRWERTQYKTCKLETLIKVCAVLQSGSESKTYVVTKERAGKMASSIALTVTGLAKADILDFTNKHQ